MMDEGFTTRNFLEGAMRGGAAALRGYMEAKVAVAQARNDAELQSANSALARERNNILKMKSNQDFFLGQQQLASQERIAAGEQEAAKFQILTDTEGKKYIVDAQGRAALAVAQEEGATAESLTQTTTEAGIEEAQIAADSALKVAELESEALVDATNIKAQAEVDQAFWERMTTGVGGKATVTPEAQKLFMSVRAAAKQSDSYKLLHATQTAVQRALALYADGGTPSDDIALMNIFQRTIDPGVSVREGDVQLQQSTMPLIEQLRATMKRVSEGVVLTPPMRQEMLQTLVTLANADYDVLLPRLEQTIGGEIRMNAELSQAGYDASDLFYIAPQRFDGTVVSDATSGSVTLDNGKPDTGVDGRVPASQTPTQTQPGGGGTDPTTAFVQRAQSGVAQGMEPAAVRAELVRALSRSTKSEAERQAILQAVDAAIGAGDGGGTDAQSRLMEMARKYMETNPQAGRYSLRQVLSQYLRRDDFKDVARSEHEALISAVIEAVLAQGGTQ